jgi:plasmid stability protein
MLRRMFRTNIYLTDEQERALRARASAEGTTKSAVVRDILDRDLLEQTSDAAVDDELGLLSDSYFDLVGDLFDHDPDLRIER